MTTGRVNGRRVHMVGPPPPTGYVPKDPHVKKALQYARDVLEGKEPACKWVKLACKRQLDDLERFADKKIYYWDEEAAGRICRFIERLPHVKGPLAKKDELIALRPFQCFILTTVFGWRVRSTDGRRYRKAYIEMARGNAKSTLSSGVGVYCTAPDGEAGAEVYSAATKHDQAKIVQGDAQAMLRKRPDFAAKLGFIVNNNDIRHPASNSRFVALSRDSKSMDGLNVHCAIIDELHAHPTRHVYDVIETACTKRLSSLLWIITTAGTDTSGICYEIRTYATRVLDGRATDESTFAIIYTLDDGDDWTSEANWLKANPNWGVSVYPDEFRSLASKAIHVASAQNNFKTKHVNLWCNADTPWMDIDLWKGCADDTLSEEDFKNDPCVIGQDLATKIDIVSRAKIFWRFYPTVRCHEHRDALFGSHSCRACEEASAGATEAHYFSFVSNYLPEAAVVHGKNASYAGWVERGMLIKTPGDVLDFAVLKADTIADREKFNLIEVAYDPWQSAQLAQELDAAGVTVVEVRATVINFSAPMKELDALVRAGRWHHDGTVDGDDPVTWMMGNVVCHTDAKDNIYPRKLKPENKIDAPVALIMGLCRAMVHTASGASAYSATRGFRYMDDGERGAAVAEAQQAEEVQQPQRNSFAKGGDA